jgi:MFS family permease
LLSRFKEESEEVRLARGTLLPALAMFEVVIDTTIMNVGLADLIRDLHTNVVGVQSALTLYTFVMATMMITGGKIGDIRGGRRTSAFSFWAGPYSRGWGLRS